MLNEINNPLSEGLVSFNQFQPYITLKGARQKTEPKTAVYSQN